MRNEKEIIERKNKIQGFLTLSEEVGVSMNYNKKLKLAHELETLDWVLGLIERGGRLKGKRIEYTPNQDEILEFLRRQTQPKSASEISLELGFDVSNTRNLLNNLHFADAIENTIDKPSRSNPRRWMVKRD